MGTANAGPENAAMPKAAARVRRFQFMTLPSESMIRTDEPDGEHPRLSGVPGHTERSNQHANGHICTFDQGLDESRGASPAPQA